MRALNRISTREAKIPSSQFGPLMRRLLGYPQRQLRNVEFGSENLDFASDFATRSGDTGFGGSMSCRQLRHPVLDAINSIITLAANATNLVPNSKILFLGAFAPILVIAALPILFRADTPTVQTSSTLSCYDGAGNYEPCVTRANMSPSQFNSRTIELHQSVSWTTTALYQQAIWPTNAIDQPENWTIRAVDQAPSSTTNAPTAQRSSASGKRPSLCGRHLIPCFFSALRRRLTHIASVAVGQARLAREHL